MSPLEPEPPDAGVGVVDEPLAPPAPPPGGADGPGDAAVEPGDDGADVVVETEVDVLVEGEVLVEVLPGALVVDEAGAAVVVVEAPGEAAGRDGPPWVANAATPAMTRAAIATAATKVVRLPTLPT